MDAAPLSIRPKNEFCLAIRGRKGGSTLVVAALHALLALAESRQKALVAQAAMQAAQTAPLAQAGLHA